MKEKDILTLAIVSILAGVVSRYIYYDYLKLGREA